MSTLENAYEFEKEKSAHDLKFFFISKGQQDIIKVIQYSFIQKLNGRGVYNLGFGDYDLDNDSITDNINSNNGDVYKIFNTVLNTIPVFFENYKNEILMVQGSDGRPEFIETCKRICTKSCNNECKNYNRRINIYRSYVDKNYYQLNSSYQFLGGIKNEDFVTILEPFERRKKYDAVFLFKKI